MGKDYKAFFGLSGPAFHKSIAVPQLYRHPQLEEWHYYLRTALDEGAVALLTGPVGAGKSTALRAFLAELDPARCGVLYVGYSTVDRVLFREMAHGLGLTPAFLKADLLGQVHTTIEQLWLVKKRQTVLVIDDAHLLKDALLVELRQLLNFQMDAATPLSLVLVGQPPLLDRLRRPTHEALWQRTLIRYHLTGLSRTEMTDYVTAHLAAVGGDPAVFSAKALDAVYQHAKGVPREINNVCVFALINAAWKETKKIDERLIAEVIQQQAA